MHRTSRVFPQFGRQGSAQRPRHRTQVGVEALEGRIVQTVSPFDPTFGQKGVVIGVADLTGTALSSGTALALQTDGKIVVVGTIAQSQLGTDSLPIAILAARRFNADGSVDTSFGTNGEITLPIPSDFNAVSAGPHNVVIESDGSIVFAATVVAADNPATGLQPSATVVTRLTSSGLLDSTFGTDGETTLTLDDAGMDAIAVGADGSIVVAGGTNNSGNVLAVARLTALGALDTSFGQAGYVINFPTDSQGVFLPPGITDPTLISASESPAVAVAITAAGQILVASNILTFSELNFFNGFNEGVLGRLNANGTFDTTFGGKGYVAADGDIADLALQPDGKIILVGNTGSVPRLYTRGTAFVSRYLADGTVDPTFQTSTATTTPSLEVTYNTVAIQPDGAIVVGGSSSNSTIAGGLIANATGLVDCYLTTGAFDTSFGLGGRAAVKAYPTLVSAAGPSVPSQTITSLAVTSSGEIVTAGTLITSIGANNSNVVTSATQSLITRLLPVALAKVTPGDYDGDGKSDFAAELAAFGLFAIRHSDGAADTVTSFGPAGLGQTIPAPGDYDGDGDGITDLAAYLPAYGVLAYRPSSGGADVIVPFGIPGAGQSIPAPGDYDGDGKTDVAVYMPALGILAYRPSSGGADVLTPFGIPGAGQSIPAPGDYDGDGKTDPAVYLPALGILAYRPSSGGTDVITPFGIPGAGQSIPAPGDYDGDGKTDIAVYLPSFGTLAYRPSAGGSDILTQFGITGVGQSIPAPGDYDGDGKTDVAVYLPALGDFAYRPSSGGSDVIEQFGIPGAGQTVAASSIPAAESAVVTSADVSAASTSAAAVQIPLTEDLVSTMLTKHRKNSVRTL